MFRCGKMDLKRERRIPSTLGDSTWINAMIELQ
jgi:hypothetical protein